MSMTLTDVLTDATRLGYRLCRVDDGTQGGLWQWQGADGTGPMFLTERAATEWMAIHVGDDGRELDAE